MFNPLQLVLLLLLLLFDIFILTAVASGYGVMFVIVTQMISMVVGGYQFKRNKLSIETLFFVDIERKKGIKIVSELWQETLLIAGTLLLFFPGFFSDIIGYLLILSTLRKKVTQFLI